MGRFGFHGRVLHLDLGRKDWITRARARHIYGVVVTDGGDIDAAATATLRAATGP